jgi:phosphoglycerate kinase
MRRSARRRKSRRPEDGEVLLLENLRFHPEEEKNDSNFARQLASLCDVYINDAFGAAHRAHASTAGITQFVQSAAAGLLMQKELDYLGRVISNPDQPFVAILGGAKVSDKIPVINALIDRKVDQLLIGGAMAYTFLKAEGFTVGKSLVENDHARHGPEIKKRCDSREVELLLPTDHQVVDSYEPVKGLKFAPRRFRSSSPMRATRAWTSASKRRALSRRRCSDAQTIIWNGPMGVFEEPPFDQALLESPCGG